MNRIARVAWAVVAALALGSIANVARAEPVARPASVTPRAPAQGVAVLALGSNAHDDAFALARAVYGSRLRPTSLDEIRARVLAGGAAPPNASGELRELAELRAGVTGEDAAGRRLLAGIAQQVGAEALLVVKVEGVSAVAEAGTDADAAAPSVTTATVTARLFLAEPGEFDAARYSPEPGPPGPAAWRSTVVSLEGRFPGGSRAPAPAAATQKAPSPLPQESGKSSPFYASAWFWGAVGGAALLGTAFYFASQDTGPSTIHLQMRVPR